MPRNGSSKGNNGKNIKKRHWAFVVYPESAPSDWVERLQQSGLQGAISPLHDKDIDPTGEKKKPHYHVIASYSGPTTYNSVKTLTDSLNQPIPQALEQVRGYYRYLTHKDNPDKHQYDENEIRSINGFNIADFVELSRSEVAAIKLKLQVLIKENDIIEYVDLMESLEDSPLEFDVASSNTLFFNTLITSRRHRKERIQVKMLNVNPETGEVLE